MPELPEVETVIRGLRKILPGKTICNLKSYAPPSVITIDPELKNKNIEGLLNGKKIESIGRRGKNILINLSDDLTLWVHLKMTGKFRYQSIDLPRNKHDLFIFDLDPQNDDHHVRFNDYRRFGRWRLYKNENLWRQKGLVELGPEPLEISKDDFIALCLSRPRMLKPALLDQSFLAGLGNIYADEALYASRLHPKRLTTSVSKKKLGELHDHIQRLLKLAIKRMGTSVDSYSGVNGQPGKYQNYLLAYNNEGNPCSRCGTKIKREKIGSRSAHFCPACQKIKS